MRSHHVPYDLQADAGVREHELFELPAVKAACQRVFQAPGRLWLQPRTGLLSYPTDPEAARAHLAASVYLQMALRPHIIHIVGQTEAHHAATAGDILIASRLARRAIENALSDQPDMTADPRIHARRAQLVQDAQVTLAAIQNLTGFAGFSQQSAQLLPAFDPFTDPENLALAVTSGILDAPQLRNNPYGKGVLITRIINGQCLAVDPTGRPISEDERLANLNLERVK